MTLIYQTKFLARERRLLRVGADCDWARTLRSAQAGSALDALRRLAGGNHSTFFYILFQSSSSPRIGSGFPHAEFMHEEG